MAVSDPVVDPAAALDPAAVLDPVASTDPEVDPGVDPGVGGGAIRVMWMHDTARPSGGQRVATREKDGDAEVWTAGAAAAAVAAEGNT